MQIGERPRYDSDYLAKGCVKLAVGRQFWHPKFLHLLIVLDFKVRDPFSTILAKLLGCFFQQRSILCERIYHLQKFAPISLGVFFALQCRHLLFRR